MLSVRLLFEALLMGKMIREREGEDSQKLLVFIYRCDCARSLLVRVSKSGFLDSFMIPTERLVTAEQISRAHVSNAKEGVDWCF